jgi:DNA-binding LacI/PurR family transcriptional regulator
MARVTEANMREVAARAGVSHVTVSRALRNDPRVKAATKARVLAAVEELGYRPNPLVNAYAAQIRKRSGEAQICNLGWVTATPERHPAGYFAWIRPYLEGAVARASALGFSLDTDLEVSGLSLRAIERQLLARGIRGILLPHVHYFGASLAATEHWAAVSIGNRSGGAPMHTVRPNAFENTRMAMETLIARGRKRIGFVENRYSAHQGRGLYEAAFLYERERLPKRRQLPVLTGLQVEPLTKECKARFYEWFEAHQPDAILTTFMQPRKWLREIKVGVPDNVTLAHLAISEENADWSGINVGARSLGSAAVDLLAAHIARNEYGIPSQPKHMSLTGTWQDGAT